ncbi:patatin family protein [Xylanibacillus composti]|uniref:Patatin family protein n=1 Tax=Xylanibacillus composti TaxID=1572762 RepID=A0A8J4M383_9BACL|nr:patatin family protein [Xylanibacillus composti]MDT9724465.1 patatin family protein [Xylanibacillus composti]GIQ69727.1 patatin family protein [Xylanibacillus composti]
MNRTGLVLEGGGMRGVYTAGVLEYFLEQEFHIPHVTGVSAGASIGASYVSRQRGRNEKITIGYIDDPRYIGIGNWFRERSLFGMDFVFGELPNVLVPLDYKTFHSPDQQFWIGTTDCRTGQARFFHKNESDDVLRVVRASSSLPIISPIVEIDRVPYLDGGISEPIPVAKSEQDGNERHIIVLTREAGYRKTPSRMSWLNKRLFRQYPRLVETMERRHKHYNDTLDRISAMEKDGTAFVFRPEYARKVGRMEKDKRKLTALYQEGYEAAKRRFAELNAWLA